VSKINPKNVKSGSADAEIRKHYFLDRYVIIAPKRNLRPDDLVEKNPSHTTETAESPHIEADKAVYQIKTPRGGWHVKVIQNKFPALTLDNPKAYGRQEVVIETPDHNAELSQQSVTQIERVFKAYAERVAVLKQIPGVRYVSVFKNDGPNAGASIAHAHSQIIALPVVPPLVETEAVAAQEYIDDNATCPYCDIIEWERTQKVRVIAQDKHVIAFAPYASLNPYEAWLMPRQHRGTFAELTAEERHSMAVMLKKIIQFLDKGRISYNYFLQDSLEPYQHHFSLRVEPRQTIWAGLELSTGVIINPVTPESASAWYKASK
jgi:UDPglucose--hexose-1-phosphate uridylyltransferase